MTDQTSQEIGFNNNLRVGKRKLHVQTVFLAKEKKATSSVFENGRLIDKRETAFDSAAADLEKEVKQFHQLVLSDLEMLFFVQDKVEQSKIPDSIQKLGVLFLEKGFIDEAVEQLRNAVKMDPDLPNCFLNLGQALFRKGEYSQALENLMKSAERNPDYPDVHLAIGKCHWQMGDYPLAISTVQKALDLNPDYHEAYFTLGLILLKSKTEVPKHVDLKPPIERIKDAELHLRKAISLSKEYDLKLMEEAFEKLKLRDKEEAGYNLFLQASQTHHWVSPSSIADQEFYLKFMFSSLDRDNKALDHFLRTIEKSIEKNPEYADLHKSLGTAYLIKCWHFFTLAVEEHRRAVQINPAFEKAVNHLKLLENDSRGFLILLQALLK
ncbi:MAG TPA: tetratricopeptide repeat protein [bacterium]|nr:tetratricopeptide repeat protein [bacterium]HOX85483.1 tetratricopeptide repeat protein [bacterium]HPG44642.1 tetratricopeptide repeat protein [bacterium]HPM97200.1 tetratricopeptide repeat protein [bacterium]